MPNTIQQVISEINIKQFAYPHFQNRLVGIPEQVGGEADWDPNYRWYTFKEMVNSDRGYDCWLWPIPALRLLQKAELLHPTANTTSFRIIEQCEGQLRERDRAALGKLGDYVSVLKCGEGKIKTFMHDTVIWREDNMHKIYNWYAKLGGWID